MKYVDEQTRSLVHAQRIESLEQDNFMAKNRIEDLTADHDLFKIEDELLPKSKKKAAKVVKGTEIEEQFDGIKKKRKHKTVQPQKKKKRPRMTLEEILNVDNVQPGDFITNFLNTIAQPSRYPRRYFCSVCGFEFKYTCLRCGEKFCSKRCGLIHKETRCLKFAD